MTKASANHVEVQLAISEEHLNRNGTLHGGCTATFVNVVSSVAVALTGKAIANRSLGVSVA